MRIITISVCAILCLNVASLDAQETLGKTPVQWAAQLKHNDAKMRRSAAFALGKTGRRIGASVNDLKAAYANEKDAKVRDAIVFALGEVCRDVKLYYMHYSKADDDIAQKMANEHPEICLGPSSGTTELETMFVGALRDTDAHLRRSGAFALGCLASKSDAARQALQTALGDQHAMVRQNAAWGLWQFGDDAVPLFQKALGDTDSLVKRDAASALLRVPNSPKVRDLVDPLLALCRDNNSEVRRAALAVLVRLVDSSDKNAITALRGVLDDKDVENRRYAAVAISNIGGEKSAVALPILLETARGADLQARREAVLAIRNLGGNAVSAMPELIRYLRDDPDDEVRKHAALAIGGVGEDAAKKGATFIQLVEGAVPTLVEKIQNANERAEVRKECAMALARIGPVFAAANVATKLLAVIADPDHDATVRERIMWALRVHEGNLKTMAGADRAFAKIMKEPLTQQNKMLRYDCAYMLGMIWRNEAPDHALDVLLEFLHDKDVKVYRGTTSAAGSASAELKGVKGGVKEQGFGDGRTMATDALANIGAARYGQNAAIMKQLKVLADTSTDPDLKKKAQTRLDAVR